MSSLSSSSLQRRTIAVACVAIVLLSGCSTQDDSGAGPLTGQSSEQARTGDNQDTRSGPRDDVEIGTELPDGFPVEDVPLLEGTIISAGGTQAEGIWVVMIHAPETVDTAQRQAIALLTAAGYTEHEDLPGMNAYTKDDLNVTVRVGEAETPNGTVVNYTINRRA